MPRPCWSARRRRASPRLPPAWCCAPRPGSSAAAPPPRSRASCPSGCQARWCPARWWCCRSCPTPPGPAGGGRPFFCVHRAGGNVLCSPERARAVGRAQPFYGLQLPDLDTLGPAPSIEDIAARYVAAILTVETARGEPHALGGWSLGGAIAYEMARQLWSAGHRVDPLVLIDPPPPGEGEGQSEGEEAARLAADFAFDLAAMHAGGGGAAAGPGLAVAGGAVEIWPGSHYSLVRPPAVATLAAALRRRLAVR